MKTSTSILLVIAAGIPIAAAALTFWVWVTIPPEVDPAAVPSRVLAPPAVEFWDAVEEGRSIARSRVAEEKLPGLSLAVAVDGSIVWAEGFRWADLESEVPVTPATLFRIGGVSQTLTAAAAGLLSQRGRLDLDAPVRRYLPDFLEKEWPVSTRQLLAHTAGLRSERGEGELFRRTGCADDGERLAIFAGDPFAFRLGTQVSYSTYGVVLAGAVVAAAAGEPYLEFLRREILAPAGMEETVPDLAGSTRRGTARFYYPRLMLDPRYGLQDAPAVDLSCILPAGGFLSTPSDLVRFVSAMTAGSLLDPATVAELQTPPDPVSRESGQALGWVVRQLPLGVDGAAVRVVGQGLADPVRRQPLSATTVGGLVAGGTAALLVLPEPRIAVAVAANVSGARSVPLLATELAELFLSLRQGQGG